MFNSIPFGSVWFDKKERFYHFHFLILSYSETLEFFSLSLAEPNVLMFFRGRFDWTEPNSVLLPLNDYYEFDYSIRPKKL